MQSQRTTIELLRYRRHSRGAVLVEAVIVSAMLMTMMAGGLFLHRLYYAKIQGMGDARAAGWSQALQGCDSPIDLNAVWHQTGATAAPGSVDTGSVPGFFGEISHASGSGSGTAAAHARVGGGSYTLSTSNTIACDEKPQPERGDLASLLGFIQSSFVPNF
jgi:hypothetical protein